MKPVEREILIRALKREKAARKQAEKILEEKSLEYYEISRKLKIANNTTSKKPKHTNQPKIQYSSLPDAMVRMDLKGNILKMNEAAVDLFGYNSEKEYVNAKNLIHRDDFSYAMKCFNELLKRGRFTDYVARVYTKNEPSKRVHINANIVYDSMGRPIGAQGIIHDITKESRVRTIIETQRAELAAIVNHSPLGITLTEQGELKKYNKAFQNMIGYTSTEMLNLNPEDLVRNKDLIDYNKFKNDFDSGLKSHSEYISHMTKKDGSIILVKIIVTSILDENKYPRYRLSMFEDITKKSKQDKLVIEQQKQLKIIVENSPLGILLIKNKIIHTANETFQTLLGYSQKELTKMTMREFIYEQDIEKTKTFVRKIEKGAQNPVVLIHRLVKKNKSLVTVKASVSAVTNQVGNLDYMVAVFEDISKQEKTKKQKEKLLKKLKISNKQLQGYAHVVSHDLKSATP